MSKLDHVVVNTLHGMDVAAATFAALGFTLTPLGRHSLGSTNHLMLTPDAYIELIGVPESGLQRQEVLNSPLGLSGLVFATEDPDGDFARLNAAGLGAMPPQAFSRPVDIAGVAQDARFRTVRVATDVFPAGRVYFCQHLTPALVWRREWLAHVNGFRAIQELVIESPDPESDARLYACACASEVRATGGVWTISLPGFDLLIVEGIAARFASLSLLFTNLDVLERCAAVLPDVTWTRHDGTTADLTLRDLRVNLSCRVTT